MPPWPTRCEARQTTLHPGPPNPRQPTSPQTLSSDGHIPQPPPPPSPSGYPLSVTLSESGGVSRGLCQVDQTGALQKLTEGLQMRRAGDRVRGRDVAGRQLDVPLDAFVCTNLWGFPEAPL